MCRKATMYIAVAIMAAYPAARRTCRQSAYRADKCVYE